MKEKSLEIDALDNKSAELRKERDSIEVKKNVIEKKFETNKKNLNEKIG